MGQAERERRGGLAGESEKVKAKEKEMARRGKDRAREREKEVGITIRLLGRSCRSGFNDSRFN